MNNAKMTFIEWLQSFDKERLINGFMNGPVHIEMEYIGTPEQQAFWKNMEIVYKSGYANARNLREIVDQINEGRGKTIILQKGRSIGKTGI